MKILVARLAGVSFRPDEVKEHLRTLRDGAQVRLEAEPTNQHDKHAIRVMSGDLHLGYVGAGSPVPGRVRNTDFHRFPEAWAGARFKRNDAGDLLVAIGGDA